MKENHFLLEVVHQLFHVLENMSEEEGSIQLKVLVQKIGCAEV